MTSIMRRARAWLMLLALALAMASAPAFAQPVPVSHLPAAAPLNGSELFSVTQSGNTVKTTVAAAALFTLGKTYQYSLLPVAGALTGAEITPVNQSGSASQSTVNAIANFAANAGRLSAATRGNATDLFPCDQAGSLVKCTALQMVEGAMGSLANIVAPSFGAPSFQLTINESATPGASVFVVDSDVVCNRTNGNGHRECVLNQLTSNGAGTGDFLSAGNAFMFVQTGAGLAFGHNSYVGISAGVNAATQATGDEIDTDVRATINAKVGLRIADVSTSTSNGTLNSAGLQIEKQSGALGYDFGILFGDNAIAGLGGATKALIACPPNQGGGCALPRGFDWRNLATTVSAIDLFAGTGMPGGIEWDSLTGTGGGGGALESDTTTLGPHIIYASNLLAIQNSAESENEFLIDAFTGNTTSRGASIAPTEQLTGTSSGTITIQPQAAAGTYNWNLPTTAGSAGQLLVSGGGSTAPMTWLTPPAGAIVGTSATQTLTNKSISVTQITGVATVAQGGTNSGSASGTALDNIAGFSCTGLLARTGAGSYACFNGGSVELFLTGVNFNSANSDNAIPVLLPVGTRYVVANGRIFNASASLTTATVGVFTAAAGGGTAVVTGGTAVTVSSTADNTANNAQLLAVAATNTFNIGTLYLRIGTPQGSAATGSFLLTLVPLNY